MTRWDPPHEGERVRISYSLVVAIKMLEEATAKVFDGKRAPDKFLGLGDMDIIADYPLDMPARDSEGLFTDRLRNMWVSLSVIVMSGGSYPVRAKVTVHQGRYFALGFGWRPQSARITLASGKEFSFVWTEGVIQQK
jgi:hypothetical protein